MRYGHETERAYQVRRFNNACERMSRCYALQRLRTLEGNIGAAYFYQLEAALYYRYMVEAKAKFDTLIPRFHSPMPGNSIAVVGERTPSYAAMKLAASSAYGKFHGGYPSPRENATKMRDRLTIVTDATVDDIAERLNRMMRK